MITSGPIRILAFSGLVGSGKTLATEYLASRGVPRIAVTGSAEQLQAIDSLIHAGQHLMSIDDLTSIQTMRDIRHAYPDSLHVIAIVSSHKNRLARTRHQINAGTLDASDWHNLEDRGEGAVIALADHTLINDGSISELQTELDKLLRAVLEK